MPPACLSQRDADHFLNVMRITDKAAVWAHPDVNLDLKESAMKNRLGRRIVATLFAVATFTGAFAVVTADPASAGASCRARASAC